MNISSTSPVRAAALSIAVVAVLTVVADESGRLADRKQVVETDQYMQMAEAIEAGESEKVVNAIEDELAHASFSFGLKAFAQGDYQAAVQAFQRVLEVDPTHHRARLELARSFYKMGMFYSAKAEFLEVLSHDPPASVRRNVEKFMAGIDEVTEQWNLSMQVAVGVLYDNNVNVGPESSMIRLAPFSVGGLASIDTLEVAKESRPLETWGGYLYLAGRAGKDIGITQGWKAYGQAEYYSSVLEGQADDFEIQFFGLTGALTLLDADSMLELPLRYQNIDEGEGDLVDILGLNPSYTWVDASDRQWISRGLIQYRDYRDVVDRDSKYIEIDQSARQMLAGGKVRVTSGLTGFYESADADIYSNYGFEPMVSVEWFLGEDMACSVRGSYRREWYDEREILAPDDREDDRYEFSVNLAREVGERWAVMGRIQYTENSSTFDIYEYNRSVVTVGMLGTL